MEDERQRKSEVEHQTMIIGAWVAKRSLGRRKRATDGLPSFPLLLVSLRSIREHDSLTLMIKFGKVDGQEMHFSNASTILPHAKNHENISDMMFINSKEWFPSRLHPLLWKRRASGTICIFDDFSQAHDKQ